MSRFRELVKEIHRRSIWQVLAVYAVASWVIYQVVLALYDGLGLPGWVPGTALVLLLLGLPIVLATAIVQEGPPDLREGRSRIVEGLETTADAVSTDRRAAQPALAEEGAALAPRGRTLFSWNRAITGGVLAFAALGLAASGFMGMRAMGIGPAATLMTSGVLDERDFVVLAEFGNGTRNAELSSVVTEAFRIQLEQSPVLNVADRAYVARVLELMQRDPAEPPDADVARELAQREGIKAVIAGEIARVGGGYVLSARILAPADGRVLAAFSQMARDSTQLIDAIDKLARDLREKAGESLRTIRADAPLAQVSTRSLAALRRYSEALVLEDRNDLLGTRRALEDAIALDSTFAMAWRKLGVVLGNTGAPRSERDAVIAHAHELRDRLTERERLHVTAYHQATVEDDPDAAIRTYRALLAAYPDDRVATHNLALYLSTRGGRAEAVDLYRTLAERPDAPPVTFTNLMANLARLGRYDEVERYRAEARARFPDNPGFDHAYRIMGARGEFFAAHDSAAAVRERYPANADVVEEAVRFQYLVDRAVGRLAHAEMHVREWVEMRRAEGYEDAEAIALLQRTAMALENQGDVERALERTDRLERLFEALPPIDRPYPFIASLYARAGQPQRARAVLDRHDSVFGSQSPIPPRLGAEADLALAEGDAARALDLLRDADRLARCDPCGGLLEKAHALELLGQEDSAVAHYREFLDRPGYRMSAYAGGLQRALLGLADLHERRGEAEEAAALYGRYLELMEQADPEFRPRIEAARRALTRLTQEGGA